MHHQTSEAVPAMIRISLAVWEFEGDGTATEKACGPSVLSWHRGTTKKRQGVKELKNRWSV